LTGPKIVIEYIQPRKIEPPTWERIMCEYVIWALDHCGTPFRYERLGFVTSEEAEAALTRAWEGHHECLNMWLEQYQ
jgi:hypothetical protein